MGTIFKLFEGFLEQREETTNLSRLTVPLTGHSIPPPPPPRLSTRRGPSASPPSIAGAEDDFLRGRQESLPSSSSSSRLRPRPAVKSPISEEGRPELELRLRTRRSPHLGMTLDLGCSIILPVRKAD